MDACPVRKSHHEVVEGVLGEVGPVLSRTRVSAFNDFSSPPSPSPTTYH